MQVTALDSAIFRFKQANARDPSLVLVEGEQKPRELVRAERLEAWVLRLDPAPSDALRLAAHCQHLRRWEIPRTSFPKGRLGYLKWRKALAKFHAQAAGVILREVGVDEATVQAVRRINLKQGLATDPDTKTIEDALCLSFLEHEFDEFTRDHEAKKVLEILEKTWRKMSERGRRAALELELSPNARELLLCALAAPRQNADQ